MAGKTFFEQKWKDSNGVEHDKVSYADVPVDKANDNAISTPEFLLATKSLLTLFDIMGSVAFLPVTKDISGNVDKLEKRYNAATPESSSLQSLVRAELSSKSHTATEGLLWLTRGLDLTAQALRNNVDGAASNEALSTSFRTSYGKTLSKHHSFLIKPIFNAAVSAAPARQTFYNKLAGVDVNYKADPAVPNAKEAAEMDRMEEQLGVWLKALEERVAILNEFMGRKEAKW